MSDFPSSLVRVNRTPTPATFFPYPLTHEKELPLPAELLPLVLDLLHKPDPTSLLRFSLSCRGTSLVESAFVPRRVRPWVDPPPASVLGSFG